MLAAYAIGLEIGGAIGRAFGPGHFLRGWHPTATVGAFASTAVAARLHRLDADGVVRAFGIAASQVGGMARNFGTMAKPFHAGHAARTGIVSAWMAKQGLTTDGEIFDGKRGVLDTYEGGDGEPIEAVLETLGKPWEILKPGNYVKRWPCCYSGHRTLGALYGMIDKHGLTPGNVEEVSVSFLPGGDTALFSRDPQTGLEAKFSIEYMVAAALLDGPLKMATFADDMVRAARGAGADETGAPYPNRGREVLLRHRRLQRHRRDHAERPPRSPRGSRAGLVRLAADGSGARREIFGLRDGGPWSSRREELLDGAQGLSKCGRPAGDRRSDRRAN